MSTDLDHLIHARRVLLNLSARLEQEAVPGQRAQASLHQNELTVRLAQTAELLDSLLEALADDSPEPEADEDAPSLESDWEDAHAEDEAERLYPGVHRDHPSTRLRLESGQRVLHSPGVAGESGVTLTLIEADFGRLPPRLTLSVPGVRRGRKVTEVAVGNISQEEASALKNVLRDSVKVMQGKGGTCRRYFTAEFNLLIDPATSTLLLRGVSDNPCWVPRQVMFGAALPINIQMLQALIDGLEPTSV